MVVAALAKGAAKASKGAAKASKAKAYKGTKPGQRRAGDTAYDARRQYYRSAERYLDKARSSTGEAAARYRQLAKQDFENALGTYDPDTKQPLSKPMQRLADEFGVDVSKRREASSAKSKSLSTRDLLIEEQQKAMQKERRERLIAKSDERLEKNLKDPEVRREMESRALLNNDEIGSRILGGTVDIWKGKASVNYIDEEGNLKTKVDNRKILPALYDYFQVDNLSDLVEEIEGIAGSDLYKTEDDYNIYQDVKITIQKHIKANNKLVA